MADWKDNKGAGPWDFTEQPNKWGYLNNPLWSNRQDSVNFCAGLGLEVGLLDKHKPCGHWHRGEVVPMIDEGKWVAAMQQPGTPYIYVYDIVAKAVIRINTSVIPVIVDGIVRLNSAYTLDYDMGYGNPGAQRGAYCMNKDGTRIWYLFCDQGQDLLVDRPDAELVEVDISSYYMRVVKRTLFPNLLPADVFPGPNRGQVNDGCSDDTHTYWCTELIAGRIIKIRNSDHVIVDDHYFNYPLECGHVGGGFNGPIATIDVNKNTEKLYWVYCRDHSLCIPVYSACRHLIRADLDLTADIDEVVCGTGFSAPGWQNMIRIYSNYILHHRAYFPSSGYLMKRGLNCIESGEVEGTNNKRYACVESHTATIDNEPVTGGEWSTYWEQSAESGGDTWTLGYSYIGSRIEQEYLQNIFGIKDEKIFTLMHLNTTNHPAFLYCINFFDMKEISKLDVSYYAGQIFPPGGYDWAWTSVSAMNQQTGVIAIFRYNNSEGKNHVACFNAGPSLSFLCDTRFEQIYDDPTLGPFGEPQSWPFEGFTAPPIPSTDPPVEVISDPGPGEIIYEPPPPPPDDVPDDGVTLLQSGFIDYMSVGPGQTLFFKFVGVVLDCSYPVQVGNTSAPPYTVHMTVKRESKPTIADFELTWPMPPSQYNCGLSRWAPTKVGAENLYWNYNTGSQAEFVQIGEPMGFTTFYIMLYNNGRQAINTRLSVHVYD